jgi:predicted nucleic acid-binding protein
MTRFVLDASLALAWCFADEATSYTESLLDRMKNGDRAIVPPHWPVEILNVLIHAKRKKRITDEKIEDFLQRLTSFDISVDAVRSFPLLKATRQLADAHRLTSYDAVYLELALRFGLPLASLDGDLRKAAQAEGVQMVEQSVQ